MHIIWDFNGTLLYDAQLSVDCDNCVFDALGLPRITIDDYRAHMTMPVRSFYAAPRGRRSPSSRRPRSRHCASSALIWGARGT